MVAKQWEELFGRKILRLKVQEEKICRERYSGDENTMREEMEKKMNEIDPGERERQAIVLLGVSTGGDKDAKSK